MNTDALRTTTMTGPHPAADRYGRFDHYYWRCEACGFESTRAALDGRCSCERSERELSGRAERVRRCPRCAD